MTEPQPRMGHWPKIIRAEEHLASVVAEIDFWREQDVCTAIGKFETPEAYVIRVEERIPPPVRLSLLIGDTVTTLNSALDHLAYALVSHYSPDRVADPDRLRGISFPIHESETYTDKRGIERTSSFEGISGVPDFVVAHIQKSQPYVRRDEAARHPLAVIRRLANTDKHRTLLLSTIHFSRGGMFGLRIPNHPGWFRQEIVYGDFTPGAQIARFALTVDELRAAGCQSSDDVKVHGYAAAGVVLGEPGMDSRREVPEILRECVDFTMGLFTWMASRLSIW